MAEDGLISLIANMADRSSRDVIIGIGDDAAVLNIPNGRSLVTCTDTLISSVHFPADTDASSVGHKSLAVNLSDIAAMGAIPRWAQLSLTLPAYDEIWVTEFLRGFLALADRHGVVLVGGDTCAGPLSITVQVMGLVDEGILLKRGTAAVDDLLAVTGCPGEAALALQILQRGESGQPELLQKLNEPEPHLAFSQSLLGIASSCIDISDGLLLDLERLLQTGSCGAQVDLADLPCSEFLDSLPLDDREKLQLSGGDDYELCFSLPPSMLPRLTEITNAHSTPFSIIGRITATSGVKCYDRQGNLKEFTDHGFQHFG